MHALVQEMKLAPALPASKIQVLAQVLAAPVLIQSPVNTPRRAAKYGLSMQSLASPMRNLDGIPSSWFQSGPASVISAMWVLN